MKGGCKTEVSHARQSSPQSYGTGAQNFVRPVRTSESWGQILCLPNWSPECPIKHRTLLSSGKANLYPEGRRVGSRLMTLAPHDSGPLFEEEGFRWFAKHSSGAQRFQLQVCSRSLPKANLYIYRAKAILHITSDTGSHYFFPQAFL